MQLGRALKGLLGLLVVVPLYGFEYEPLPEGNLLQNPWFNDGAANNCKWSGRHWEVNEVNGRSWYLSDKTQDPIDVYCEGETSAPEDWVGFAMRWARNSGAGEDEFVPNQDAKFWQVVGPVSPDHTKLNFHFLMVFHRMNRFRAQISGSDNANGPWTVVWTPIDKTWLQEYGANGPDDCEQLGLSDIPKNRDCLWDVVTEAELGSCPRTSTIGTGYAYYKIEFLGNYPEEDDTSTGDVGGKIARVFFNVSPPSEADLPEFCAYSGGANDDNNNWDEDAGVGGDSGTANGNGDAGTNNPAASSSGGCDVAQSSADTWSAMLLLLIGATTLLYRASKPRDNANYE